MHFIICYNILVNASSFKTQTRKGLISYYKINGITTFNKHVIANHAIVAKTFEDEINSLLRKLFRSNQQRKGLTYLANKYPNFFL
jgi:hypothetical protein